MEELKRTLEEVFKSEIIKIVISNKVKKDEKYNKIAINLKENKLHLDLNKRRVFVKDEEIELQNKQFNLLEYLLLNKGSILLKEQIYDRVWGIDSDVTIEIVEVYISHLRKKLSKYGYDK